MSEKERLEDLVAWGNRLNPDESQAILDGKKVIKTLYLDGSQYLRIELSLLDTNIKSQII